MIVLLLFLLLSIFASPRGKDGYGHKSYREIKLEQNIWRCDCSNEGTHTEIDRHESWCRYAAWYIQEDMDAEEDQEDL